MKFRKNFEIFDFYGQMKKILIMRVISFFCWSFCFFVDGKKILMKMMKCIEKMICFSYDLHEIYCNFFSFILKGLSLNVLDFLLEIHDRDHVYQIFPYLYLDIHLDFHLLHSKVMGIKISDVLIFCNENILLGVNLDPDLYQRVSLFSLYFLPNPHKGSVHHL